MDVRQAINDRRSIRAFTDQPVSKELLHDVLTVACRAISGVNSQPWEFAVVTGDLLKKISEDNIELLRAGAAPDMRDSVLYGVYRERQKEIGKTLLQSVGIERHDKERRAWWNERGFRYFDAPAAIIIYTDKELMTSSNWPLFEIGCISQNICIAAMEHGLGTCVAGQPVTYQRGLRKYLNIPESKELIIGIPIGYPDWSFPPNQVVSKREEVNDLTTWYGFD